MRAQLEAQAAGMSGRGWLGRADVHTGVVGKVTNSLWLGGAGFNSGESYPYWFNGAWPNAVLLNDADLLAELVAQIEYVRCFY